MTKKYKLIQIISSPMGVADVGTESVEEGEYYCFPYKDKNAEDGIGMWKRSFRIAKDAIEDYNEWVEEVITTPETKQETEVADKKYYGKEFGNEFEQLVYWATHSGWHYCQKGHQCGNEPILKLSHFEKVVHDILQKQETDSVSKPPMGVIPEWLWREKRLDDLCKAIWRYDVAGKPRVKEWVDEYSNHREWLHNYRERVPMKAPDYFSSKSIEPKPNQETERVEVTRMVETKMGVYDSNKGDPKLTLYFNKPHDRNKNEAIRDAVEKVLNPPPQQSTKEVFQWTDDDIIYAWQTGNTHGKYGGTAKAFIDYMKNVYYKSSPQSKTNTP